MICRLLGVEQAVTYDAQAGALPASPKDHSAYVLTGSPAGVYDGLPWIEPLKDFLREAKGEAKLVGICFGHQIMAEAFGGRVEKSAKGWGAGLHEYRIVARPAWIPEDVETIAIPVSHQDQVVIQPPRSEIVAASGFTPFAALAYADHPSISFQGHPEFAPEFARALIERRRDRLPDPDAALASLDRPSDGRDVGAWIRRFLES